MIASVPQQKKLFAPADQPLLDLFFASTIKYLATKSSLNDRGAQNGRHSPLPIPNKIILLKTMVDVDINILIYIISIYLPIPERYYRYNYGMHIE